MASPAAPLTPPAEPGSTQNLTQSQSQAQSSTLAQSSTQAQASTQNTTGSGNARVEALLASPLTSLTDDGTSRRPRDHRLIHLLLASHGVNAYQERVPLQLMDFAYRYASSILSDALHMQMEGYDQAAENAPGAGGKKSAAAKANAANKAEEGDISLPALKMAIQSRMAYQFTGQGNLPKEFLKGLADERNRISLQQHIKEGEGGVTIGGLRLPHERYCLTGQGWGLKNEWDSQGEESDEDGEANANANTGAGAAAPEGEDMQMEDADEDMGENEDGEGDYQDLFGQDNDGDKDTEMKD